MKSPLSLIQFCFIPRVMVLSLACITLGGLVAFGNEAESASHSPPAWKLARRSRLWLEGDSSLHRYRADAKEFYATMSVAPSAQPHFQDSLLKLTQLGAFRPFE